MGTTIASSWLRGISRRLQSTGPLFFALAFGLAALAQDMADQRTTLWWALALYVLAAALMALGTWHDTREPKRVGCVAPVQVRWPQLAWALVFFALTLAGSGGNRLTLQNVLPWGIAILLCLSAFRPGAADEGGNQPNWWSRAWRAASRDELRLTWPACGLIAATLLGAYLRLVRLLEFPADLGWDLPYNFFDVQRILRGESLIFFRDNFGREGMFFYLAAAVSRLNGLSPYSIRIASALVGVVTIPAIYLLAKECFSREVGVYAAFLLAVNAWHITLTRSGYRVSLFPLFAILALYGLARALRRGGARDWAWCGLFTGLGLWTYKAFVFAWPLVIGCALVHAALNRRWASALAPAAQPIPLAANEDLASATDAVPDTEVAPTPTAQDPTPIRGTLAGRISAAMRWLDDHVRLLRTGGTRPGSPAERPETRWPSGFAGVLAGLGIAATVGLVAWGPMARFVVESSDIYLARERQAAKLVSGSMGAQEAARFQVWEQNIATSLLMFNYRGDANNRFGVANHRQMGYISGILMVLGVAAALTRPRHGANAVLVLSVLGFIAPMTVTMLAGEHPNCFRSAGTIGPALVLGASALAIGRRQLATLTGRAKMRWLNLELANGATPEAAPPRLRLSLRLPQNLAWVSLVLVAVILGVELRESDGYYFREFRKVAPDVSNYSMALELAKAIIAYTDGSTYIKPWPHWYDGRGVQAHLAAAGRSWTAEIPDLRPDRPPLAGFQGRLLVLLHPDDKQGLEVLEAYFPRYNTRLDHFPDGRVSFVTFVGEK